MARVKISTKKIMVNKANAQTMVMIAVAAIVVVFSLVASKALLGQRSYQSRVIGKKEVALKQLKANSDATDKLVEAYNEFINSKTNAIGGDPKGIGDRDGDNAKIILDALPSQYDFPALATSLEKILSDPAFKIDAITGVDDEINQQASAETSTPQPVEMPFSIAVTGSYASMQKLLDTLDRSIRPFQIQSIDFSGKDASMKVEIKAKTFYQPEKTLNIRTEEVR